MAIKGVTYVETAGSLTNTTATLAANPARTGLIIGNPSDTVMTFRIGATASATAGVPIPAGNSVAMLDNCPSGSVSIFCAGTAKSYTAYEMFA